MKTKTASQFNTVLLAREQLVPKGWVEKTGQRNTYFYSPSGKRRLIVMNRNVRVEKRVEVDHGPNTYGKRIQIIWVCFGSVTHKKYAENVARRLAGEAYQPQEEN